MNDLLTDELMAGRPLRPNPDHRRCSGATPVHADRNTGHVEDATAKPRSRPFLASGGGREILSSPVGGDAVVARFHGMVEPPPASHRLKGLAFWSSSVYLAALLAAMWPQGIRLAGADSQISVGPPTFQ